jgi:acyl-CoA synthetase (AMP-forming)/AMP-acid ligase II
MSVQETESLGKRIRAVLSLDPLAVAVETGLGLSRWSDIAEAARAIEHTLQTAGIGPDRPIGWVARNRAAAVASFASLVMNGRMVIPLRPKQTSSTLPEELAAQKLQAVIGDADDWTAPGAIDAAAAAGTFGLAVTGTSNFDVRVLPELSRVGPGPHRAAMPGYVLERLTSGTTGAPKRIPVLENVLIPSLRSGEQKDGREEPGRLKLKTSPALLLKPFSHAGGLFGLLLALYQARPMVLFEKFTPQEWSLAVNRHRPKSAALVPAMIEMILDADVAPQLLTSLKAVRVGTAPLDPLTQVRFEERYGVPILVDYGAAEFIGGIAGWTLADHRQFAAAKRGSVGRARPDVQLKVTAADHADELPAGASGILHIKCDRFGPDWFRTNDLASIDAGGFLFLHGRADDAINRGGFKILPEEVAAVLRRYPGVRDAAVIGRPDSRLGQVPVAAIEMAPGAPAPEPAQLEAFAREHLTAYMVPREFRFVACLPRTVSMKISRPELKTMLGIS